MHNLIAVQKKRIKAMPYLKVFIVLYAVFSWVTGVEYDMIGSLGFENIDVSAYWGITVNISSMAIPGIFLCRAIGNNFDNRCINHEIEAGYQRSAVVFSRFFSILPIAALISLIYPVLSLIRYVVEMRAPKVSLDSGMFIFSGLLLYFVHAMGLLSVGILISFICRSNISGVICGGLVIGVLSTFAVKGAASVNTFPDFLQRAVRSTSLYWSTIPANCLDTQDMILSVLSAFNMMAVSFLGSWFVFQRADLL